jgi:hypothetical protein
MHPDQRPPHPTNARPPGVPSRRAVGALVACALALGLAAGASIAPAPPSSLASDSTIVTRLLALLAAEGGGSRPSPTPATITTSPASTIAAATAAKPAPAPVGAATTTSPATPAESAPTESTGSEKSSGGEKKPVRLTPISHVWLVVLNGSGFSAVTSAPATYPYLSGTLQKQGTLLERYSAIEAYELAGDAALLTGGVGESVSTISQPLGEPAETADAFAQRAVAPILSSSAYAEHGLIVVTFGTSAQEQGLSLTTLGATPPAGALLLSPTLKAGGHNSESFNSLAPRQSLEAIFAAT